MSAQKRRKFGTWWQALLLFVVGIIILIFTINSAFSGFGGGGGRLPDNLIQAGFLLGGAITITGAVCGIVIFILAVVRAFSPKSEPAEADLASVGAGADIPQATAVRQPVDTEQSILWRLRIAIIVSMIFAGSGFWSALFVMNRRFNGPRYVVYFLVSLLLTQVPYIISLVRTARRADRVGVSIALAASIFYFGLWSWSTYKYLRFNTVLSTWVLTPILDILIFVFAWQASRIHPLDEKEKELLGAVFFAVGVYAIALHFGLAHAQRIFLR